MVELSVTEQEANQLKAALDFLIEDSQDSSLVAVCNRLNDELKALNKRNIRG